MTPKQLHNIIEYIKETEEALANWDMDGFAMQTELPMLHQTIEQLYESKC